MDELIEQSVGGFGWAQFMEVILVSLAAFFESQQSFISVYTDLEPAWHCIDEKRCNSSSNICQLPKSVWAWDRIESKTIVSERGIECSSAFIWGLPATSHFIGWLLGVIFLATLTESSLSSKKLLFLSCLTMSVTTCLTIVCNNVWFYSLLRFLSGVGSGSIGTCTIGVLPKKVGGKWQGIVKLMDPFFYLVGILSLPVIAAINPASSWKNIYLWLSIPSLLYTVILDLFVSQSPRWICLQGIDEETMAEVNTRLVFSLIADRKQSLNQLGLSLRQETSRIAIHFSPIKDFFECCSLPRTLGLLILCFCLGMVCDGMRLGIGNLGFDIYTIIDLNALLYITSFFVAKFVIKRWNWKYSLLMLLPVVSRTYGFMIALVGNESEKLQMGLVLASFLSACSANNIFLIYVIESINVTGKSNSATLMERQAISFSVIFSSVFLAAGNNNEFLIYGVSGLFIVLVGYLRFVGMRKRMQTFVIYHE